MRFPCFSLLVLLLVVAQAYDVPLEKAVPPLMEPRPQVPKITNRVFLKISVSDKQGNVKKTETVVLGLFGEIAPRLVKNFVTLARCDQGNGALSGKPLCYKGSKFHRIVPGLLIQGGDFTHGDGRGGETIYGGELIEDETFEVRHNRPYILSASNKGTRNSNGAQFFISTVKMQWLDDKYVGMGMVLEGRDFVDELEKLGTPGGNPKSVVTITDCGETKTLPEDGEVQYW